MRDLLVKQYPPLFHAATGVPSFIRVLSLLHRLRHLRVTCEGQPPSHRYWRSVVDYALISLRMAVEQVSLKCFNSLSLLLVHPTVVLYLQPNLGFGASPASRKRWAQVRHLTIHMEGFPYQAGVPTDHLKLLHGICKALLGSGLWCSTGRAEGGFRHCRWQVSPYLQNASNTRSMQPSRQEGYGLRPLQLSYLQEVELVNAAMDASQVASFIFDHQKPLTRNQLPRRRLRTGSWDDALGPLTQRSDNARWKETHQHESNADEPIMPRPAAITQQPVSRAIRPSWQQYEGRNKKCSRGKPGHMKWLPPLSASRLY